MLLSSQALVLLGGTWVAWSIIKRFFAKDPLSGIPGPPSESFITGNLGPLLQKDSLSRHEYLAKTYGGLFRINGFLGRSVLYVYDSKALHQILVKVRLPERLDTNAQILTRRIIKDTHIYDQSSDMIRINKVVFGNSLVTVQGEEHRKQRKMLVPAFSTAHMRELAPMVFDIARKVKNSIVQQIGNEPSKEINMHSWTSRTALESIGRCGYGYSFDSLDPDVEEHPYVSSVKNLIAVASDRWLRAARVLILPYVENIGSPQFQREILGLLPWKALRRLMGIVDVMHSTSLEIFRDALQLADSTSSERMGGRKDIMSVLLRQNSKAQQDERLSDTDLLSQISAFTFAGMDTTSNALARTLQLLSEHPEAQERLRREVYDAYSHAEKSNGDLDYDILMSLPFLDAVVRESLRLYPPAPQALKQSYADNILALTKPIITTDGRQIDKVSVPKGTMILASLYHCNRNPEIWGPDAAEWKPERWLSPLPESVTSARIPGVYPNQVTFLAGHRSCPGVKFAQLEMKVLLSTLVQSLRFSSSEKKVIWLNTGIVHPTTEDAPISASTGQQTLCLPLKVELM